MTHPSDVPSKTPVLWPMQWSLPFGVHAVCTTRLGGYSKEPFGSFNLGDHVSDDPQSVAANRTLLHSQLGGARPVFLSQVHGVEVAALDASTPDGTQADACLTHTSQVACTIMVADCLPLLLTDEAGSVVAAAHAGWRGLAAGVVEKIVQALCQEACVQPAQLRVWLGPCIGKSAFEVGPEVRDAFTTEGATAFQRAADCFQPHPNRPSKWLADLAGLARLRLGALGVTSVAGNDSSPAWCTVNDRLGLFSYRRDGVTGRFAVCIWRD
jgi:YfiH family protein